MDWFTWLSKTGLNPSLVYEYGLSFTHNELEEDDISYFDHEFLQSMGISIAKHRLEILKLARKHRRRPRPPHRPGVLLPRGLLVAIKSTRRRLGRYIKSWVRDEDHSPSSALVVVHCKDDNYCRPSDGYFWKLLKRKKKTASANTAGSADSGQAVMGRLLLTDGRSSNTPARDQYRITGSRLCETDRSPGVNAWTTTTTTLRGKKKEEDVEEGYWSAGVLEEIRWDSLFQDLKPT